MSRPATAPSRRTLRCLGARALLHLLLVAGALLMLLPFLWMASSALKSEDQVFLYPPRWIPSPFVWGNLGAAWRSTAMGRLYLNSALITTAVVAGQVLTSAMAAYVFARLRFPGKELIFLGLMATMMIPSEATLIPSFLILRWLGWVDTFRGLIVPALVHPFGIFMLRQSFLSIPSELEDAACIDGCSRLGILFRIVIPLSRPAISSLAVLVFTWQWNAFLWPLIVLNSPAKYTLQIGLAMLRSELATEWALLMAATLLASLPVIALYLLAQRHLQRSIALAGLRV